MSTKRPEWVKCVIREGRETWCGRNVAHEWAFEDVDHARRCVQQKSRLVPCVACEVRVTFFRGAP